MGTENVWAELDRSVQGHVCRISQGLGVAWPSVVNAIVMGHMAARMVEGVATGDVEGQPEFEIDDAGDLLRGDELFDHCVEAAEVEKCDRRKLVAIEDMPQVLQMVGREIFGT